MNIFKPGDKITRQNMNFWWKDICLKYGLDLNGVYTVYSCSQTNLVCGEWLRVGFGADPTNFILINGYTKEDIIVARIKKLYSKCKTTAHWV